MNESNDHKTVSRRDMVKDLVNNDRDKGNFFSRMGLVTRTYGALAVQTPIHELGSVPVLQSPEYSDDDDWAAEAAELSNGNDTSSRTLRYGEFRSPSWLLPKNAHFRCEDLSEFRLIQRGCHEYWAKFAEESTVLYLSGMRGSANGWTCFVRPQEDSLAAAVSDPDTFTEIMSNMHATCPIRAPFLQFATWHELFEPGQPLNPEMAVSANSTPALMPVGHIAAMRKLIDSGAGSPALGGFEKPSIRVGTDLERCSEQLIWLVTSEVASDVFSILDSTGVSNSKKYIAEEFGEKYLSQFSDRPPPVFFCGGFIFMVNDCLPKYYGGSDGTTPIVRTLILGQSAITFGCAVECPGTTIEERFENQQSEGRVLGSPCMTLTCPLGGTQNGGMLKSLLTFGIRKNSALGPQQERMDKGVIAVDVPFQGQIY